MKGKRPAMIDKGDLDDMSAALRGDMGGMHKALAKHHKKKSGHHGKMSDGHDELAEHHDAMAAHHEKMAGKFGK